MPRDDRARARDVRRLVAMAMVQAELHGTAFVVVAEPGPSDIHRHVPDCPYYVLASDASAWEKANGRLVEPEGP